MSHGLRVSRWVSPNKDNDDDKNEGKLAQAPLVATITTKGLINIRKHRGQRQHV